MSIRRRAPVRKKEKAMSAKIIVSYDGTANEDDAIALGRVFGRAGADVSLAYVRHAHEADANRESMAEEFRMTRLANRVRVGAPVYGHTRDVMSMRYIRGVELEDYVKETTGRGSARRVREMAHALLNQCRKLDLIGLDHGELSNLRKHVIIEGETPYIIDFESASQNRTMKNVTTAAQYLFVGSRLSPRIKRVLSIKSSDKILEALRRYKTEMSDENYVRFLRTFGVIT